MPNQAFFFTYNYVLRFYSKKNPFFFIFFLLGGPMDHAGPIPMVNEFSLTPESNFINQAGGQTVNNASNGPPPDHIMGAGGPRSGSPEFMSSGNFSEPQNMQNEGLVW